jgi:PAS domain S-box-containing protein
MDVFASGGEAGALMRQLDWSSTPLGTPEQWPPTLRALIPAMLASRFAMRVLWGAELIMLYNDAYRPVLGSSKHPRAMGRPTRDSFEEIWDIVGPLFLRVYAGEAVALEDSPLPLARNGYLEECYFTLSYSPIREESGEVGGLLGVVHETTDRVLAERRLRTLRDLYTDAMTTTVAATATAIAGALAQNSFDVPFALLYVTDEADHVARLVEVVGLPATSPLAVREVPIDGGGAWPLEPERRTVSLERWGPIHGGAYPEPITTAVMLPLHRPNATVPCGYLVCGVNPRRALDAPYATFFDLAAQHIAGSLARAIFDEERTRSEARERAADARMRTLFENAPAAIAVHRGPEHIFELANPMYCQLVGRRDLIGKPARVALPELEERGSWARLDHVLATGEPFIGREVPVVHARPGAATPDHRYFNFIAQPVRDADGAIAGVMTFTIEITELVTARADAERSNAMKDEFIAVVSHELRNPLSSILGWTHLLRTTALTEDKQQRALETIERNALNQSQLIEDLLDVSRIVTGKFKLEVSAVNFVDVLHAAIDSARPAIEAKQLRVRTVFDDAAVSLMGDAARLQQVV